MLALSLALLLLYLLLRRSKAAARFVIRYLTTPFKRMMGWLTNFLPFSLTEWVVILAAVTALFFLIWGIVRVARRPGKALRLYKGVTGLLAAGLLVLDGYQ